MEVSATLRESAISPQKMRLVANLVKKMRVSKAIEVLNFTNKKAAGILKKVVESAMANAEHNHGADIDNLHIASIQVNQAPSLKRVRPRAKGRANRITKQYSHVTVTVVEKEEE